MARYIEAMLITVIIHAYKVLSWVFEKPKIRVRKIDGSVEVHGTVEKTIRGQPTALSSAIYIDYWTVVWDDEPGAWVTYPTHKFQWIDNQFTMRA